MIVRAVQSIPKGEQIRNFYSERPDDEYLLDYGFCMKPGENRESYLKFQKDDIARSLRKYFKISSQTIKESMFTTDELPFFLCYENGIIPQLEDLIGNILEHRDDQSLESSFNTTETVEIETLNFLCHFCSQRRRELDRLDQDFAKAKRFGNHYFPVFNLTSFLVILQWWQKHSEMFTDISSILQSTDSTSDCDNSFSKNPILKKIFKKNT